MKTLLMVTILAMAFTAGTAGAEPFLVCDPTTDQITEYVLVIDDRDPVTSVPEDLGDGTVRLKYDLEGLSIGQHHIEVRARNIWGQSDAAPFDCIKSLPGQPAGLKISQ